MKQDVLFNEPSSERLRYWLNHRGQSRQDGRWHALYRRSSKADWKAYSRKGQPMIFDTFDAAWDFLRKGSPAHDLQQAQTDECGANSRGNQELGA